MPRKRKKSHFFRRPRVSVFVSIFFIGILFFLYYSVQNLFALASFTIGVTTPRDQIERGGEVIFTIDALNHQKGESLKIGAQFDGRKMEMLSVEGVDLGDVIWEELLPNGNETRILISGKATENTVGGMTGTPFARLTFRIIDEISQEGEGIAELCTLFSPSNNPADLTPTIRSTIPLTPQLTEVQPNTTDTNTQTPIQPTPTPTNNEDQALCVFGAGSRDESAVRVVVLPVNFEKIEDVRESTTTSWDWIEQAQVPQDIRDRIGLHIYTNLDYEYGCTSYSCFINSQEWINKALEQSSKCNGDVFLVIINENPPYRTARAVLGFGAIVMNGDNLTSVPHELVGHVLGYLADTYSAVGAVDTDVAFNCSLQCNEDENQPCEKWQKDFSDAHCLKGCYGTNDCRAHNDIMRGSYRALIDGYFNFKSVSLHSIRTILNINQ